MRGLVHLLSYVHVPGGDGVAAVPGLSHVRDEEGDDGQLCHMGEEGGNDGQLCHMGDEGGNGDQLCPASFVCLTEESLPNSHEPHHCHNPSQDLLSVQNVASLQIYSQRKTLLSGSSRKSYFSFLKL